MVTQVDLGPEERLRWLGDERWSMELERRLRERIGWNCWWIGHRG